MGALQEREIFDCLADNFRKAINLCELLATQPKKGKNYMALRDSLRLLEGAARQAAYFRNNDARWLQVGLYMNEAHKRAGDWLRGVKQPGGGYRPLTEGQKHPMFMMLADCLRKAEQRAIEFRDKKTGRMGAILPVVARGPHRDTRPVHISRPSLSKGGIILPPGMQVNG
jgi:hypothetical protein